MFECSHSSGCHKQFESLAEFEAHWKKEHLSNLNKLIKVGKE
jgi:hypothetical protein